MSRDAFNNRAAMDYLNSVYKEQKDFKNILKSHGHHRVAAAAFITHSMGMPYEEALATVLTFCGITDFIVS